MILIDNFAHPQYHENILIHDPYTANQLLIFLFLYIRPTPQIL